MSRSHKKSPWGWICRCRAGEMKEWKQESNRAIRRDDEELPSGAYYKRKSEIWASPSDGKGYMKGWYEKWDRK